MQKNYEVANKFLLLVAVTWFTTFIFIVQFGITLPWLRWDDHGIGHFFTIIFSIIGLFVSSVSSYLSIRLLKKNPSSLLGTLLLYLNFIAVLFSLFGVIILDFISNVID